MKKVLKKVLFLTLSVTMATVLFVGCGSNSSASYSSSESSSKRERDEDKEKERYIAPTRIKIMADATLAKEMEPLVNAYMDKNPDVSISVSYLNSPAIKILADNGEDYDIIIPVSEEFFPDGEIPLMDVSLSKEKLALIVPRSNYWNIESFDQVVSLLEDGEMIVAVGGPETRYDAATRAFVEKYDINEDDPKIAAKLDYVQYDRLMESAIYKQYIVCSVMYASDAIARGYTIVDVVDADGLGQMYPVIESGKKEAADFVDYLLESDMKTNGYIAEISPKALDVGDVEDLSSTDNAEDSSETDDAEKTSDVEDDASDIEEDDSEE